MCTISYRRIGCYSDFNFRQRPLPDRLPLADVISDCPDPEELKSNQTDLEAWNDYIYDLVCRCAAEAKEQKYTYFGVQACGECWAAKEEFTVNVNGLSDQCLTNNMDDCAFNSNICVGKKGAIYAYNVVQRRSLFGK
ncbi:hypothetical protein ACROYT_G029013 [Oculina patagonica]